MGIRYTPDREWFELDDGPTATEGAIIVRGKPVTVVVSAMPFVATRYYRGA